MMMDRLKAARKAGVPLVLITTPDMPATLETIRLGWNGKAPPLLRWDCATGLQGMNADGNAVAVAVSGGEPSETYSLPSALGLLQQAPERTLTILSMSDRLLNGNDQAIQAVINLRDPFASTLRTLVLLAKVPDLPPELASDVLTLHEPRPTREEIAALVTEQVNAAAQAFTVAKPGEEELRQATIALIGLPEFPCIQAVALSLREHGRIVPADLTERKRDIIRQTRGLTMNKPDLTLDCLGGLRQIKQFAADLNRGEDRPDCYVIVEELEKAVGSATTESSGTVQDQILTLLTRMEDNDWDGVIAVGPAGSGKSQFAKSIGPTYGAPVFTLDLGGSKSKYVGESEANIRGCLDAIYAVGGRRVFFIASCNTLVSVPAPLRRRFTSGVYFFDLPTDEEKAAIWPIQLARYGLALDAPRPDDIGWTGAEIRNCCRKARSFGRTPAEVACYIAPVAQTDPEGIARLRAAAAGKWLSASEPGFYRLAAAPVAQGPRRFEE